MFDKFSDRHIGVTNPEDLKAMLAVIGVKSVDELIAQVIPQSIRLKQPLALPQGMSEYEFANHIQALAAKNRTLRSFIGMGYYPCAVPAAITRNVFENPAWYTSYTPYQAEISQGRLEALLNFQTAVISLTGMEIGNCSLLDEATASLDVENETAIQEALSRLIKNKTVLIIAHRMRTVSSAGKIVVLKDGVVAEQGSLAQLLHTMKPPSLKICI